MSIVPKTCILCGVIVERGNRCIYHKKQYYKDRNAKANRQAYREALYRSFVKNDHCEICGSTQDLTKDHIVPVSKGGGNDLWNLRTLCRSCNSSKKDALIQ